MIYYTHTDGTIIGGTAGDSIESLNGITHIPSGADYAIFIDDATVNSLNPNNDAGTYTMTNIVSSGQNQYGFPTATGTLTFTVMPLAQQLSNAQSAQIAQLQAGLNATLTGGFTSKSTNHTYVTTTNGEANMHGDLTRFTLDSTLTSLMFYTTDAGWVSHTQAQLQSAFLDGGKWKDAQYAQYNTLKSQVESATTVSDVQAITWTPAAY